MTIQFPTPITPPGEGHHFNIEEVYEANVLDIMSKIYGYVPPLPLPSIPLTQAMSTQDQKTFMCVLSMVHSGGDRFFRKSIGQLALAFLKTLDRRKQPLAQEWDLERGNHLYLPLSHLFKCLHQVSDNLFLFDFGKDSTVPWKLAVTSAHDALYVCHLPPDMVDYKLAYHLIVQGICFQTLLSLKTIPCSLPSFVMLEIHLSGYKFTFNDYLTYQQQCSTIFTQPQARAMLL
jgi:hypothetical protein